MQNIAKAGAFCSFSEGKLQKWLNRIRPGGRGGAFDARANFE